MANARKRDHPQDWIYVFLGVLLFLSPWVLEFYRDRVPAWNAWIAAPFIALAAIAAIYAFEIWQDWLLALLGIWVLVSPWALGFASNSTALWTHIAIGLLMVAFAAWQIWAEPGPPAAHA